jgi:hypothetical protein
MGIAESVLQKLQALPPDKQRQILDFVEAMARTGRKARRRVTGICAVGGVHLTKEELDLARREMWANFPRERACR